MKDVATSTPATAQTNFVPWIVTASVAALALTYAAYEWRQEARLALEKVQAKAMELLRRKTKQQ